MKNESNLKARAEARMEPNFTPEIFMRELLPLLKDFFIAKIRSAENAIILQFLNGQQIILTAH